MSGRCVEVDVGALVARYAVSAFSRSVLLVVVGRGSLAVGVENECHILLDALSNSLAFPQWPPPLRHRASLARFLCFTRRTLCSV